MANPPGWDARLQFEQYVYDYMKKSGRTEAAEIFRRETNLSIDPHVPPEIDVPDGFLHEWWLTFYDHYKDHQPCEGFSAQDTHMDMQKQIDPAHEQMIRELKINSDFGLTIARASLPSASTPWSSTETDKNSQVLTSMPPWNLGDRGTQPFNHSEALKTGKAASSKGGRKKMGSVPPKDGKSYDKPGANSTSSEASTESHKDLQGIPNRSVSHVKAKKSSRGDSFGKKDKAAELSSCAKDGVVKPSSAYAKETTDGEGGVSWNSEERHSGRDYMKDLISLEDILVKLIFPSGFYIICLFVHLPLGT